MLCFVCFYRLAAQDAVAWGVWVSRYSDRLAREEGFDAERRAAAMGAANPAFILRNWVAQVMTWEEEKCAFSSCIVQQCVVVVLVLVLCVRLYSLFLFDLT